MLRLGRLLESVLLEESVSENDIASVMDNHQRVIVSYESKTKAVASGDRIVEVYAYGVTKAGNPAIRVFQPYGDTASKVPSWKLFRIDGIKGWQVTGQTFDRPADEVYKGIGDFNKNGDLSMAYVYKVTTFGDENGGDVSDQALKKMSDNGRPKQSGEVYKTDTERRMERLRQQLNDPVKLGSEEGKPTLTTTPKPSSGPQLKPGAEQNKEEDEVYRTDTERGMENLRKQLENPEKIDLSKFEPRQQQPEQPEEEAPEGEEVDDTYRTDTERGMDSLLRQLRNPQKIDLTKIPKR